jgi:alanine racemase
MVRVAALIFGYDISPGIPNRLGLEPVMRWRAKILAVHKVYPGESISYYNHYISHKEITVAIAGFGFGDGYLRNLALQNYDANADVLINGHRARLIDLNMDQAFIDVTGIDGVAPNGWVTLIGREGNDEITALELAGKAHTSNGHVCCNISARPYREYLYDGKPYVPQAIRRAENETARF